MKVLVVGCLLLLEYIYIYRKRERDQTKFPACLAVSFIIFLLYTSGSILYQCIYGCMFCMLLFNFVNYVFLLLDIMFHYVVLCMVCVNVYCTTATTC